MSLQGRSLATLKDLTPEEIRHVLDVAIDLKRRFRAGDRPLLLQGRTLAMIFQKPSLRTRVSFETGMFQLGGHALNLGPADIGLGKRESVEDTACVLSRQVDLIMARVFGHSLIEELVQHASIPVINGLSDLAHPCQVLADLMTVQERGLPLEGCRLAYIGDANNVARSLVFGGVPLGMHVTVASPPGYQLSGEILRWAAEAGSRSGGSARVLESPPEAADGASVVYTDTWTSMGQEDETEVRKRAFAGYQVNDALLARAAPDAIVLHCLPAHPGLEITHEVMYGSQSAILDEAENRLHAQKALLALLAGAL